MGRSAALQNPALGRRSGNVDARVTANEGEVFCMTNAETAGAADTAERSEDVDLVDDSDPVWRRLVTEAIGDETGEDQED